MLFMAEESSVKTALSTNCLEKVSKNISDYARWAKSTKSPSPEYKGNTFATLVAENLRTRGRSYTI